MELSSIAIVASSIPFDISKYNIAFRGLINVETVGEEKTLELLNDTHGIEFGCHKVDFVPNVFLGKVSILREVKWDPELKLGEHEDFFARLTHWRNNQDVIPSILYCPSVTMRHNQQNWEDSDGDYVERRKRVYQFHRRAVHKNGYKRMRIFGVQVVLI